MLILQRIYPKIDMNHMITVSNNIEGKGETEDNKYRIQKAGAYNSTGLFIVFDSEWPPFFVYFLDWYESPDHCDQNHWG